MHLWFSYLHFSNFFIPVFYIFWNFYGSPQLFCMWRPHLILGTSSVASNMDLESLIKIEGNNDIKCIWYWNPKFSFSHGLRPLNNDKDVLQFFKDVLGYAQIDVYIKHNIDNPKVVDESDLGLNLDDDVQSTDFRNYDVIVDDVYNDNVEEVNSPNVDVDNSKFDDVQNDNVE